jgi:hypothetical protein
MVDPNRQGKHLDRHLCRLLRIRIRVPKSGAFLTPGSEMEKIWDLSDQGWFYDPGSWINIPDPQHCLCPNKTFIGDLVVFRTGNQFLVKLLDREKETGEERVAAPPLKQAVSPMRSSRAQMPAVPEEEKKWLKRETSWRSSGCDSFSSGDLEVDDEPTKRCIFNKLLYICFICLVMTYEDQSSVPNSI